LFGAQHHIIYFLSLILPTCVLGDPMQAIFGFRGNALADWNQHVCTHFPVVGDCNALAMAQRRRGSAGTMVAGDPRLLAAGSRWICVVGHRSM
jgi:DNA helicase-2/ATP-dependent DNA helicase PcrA